jgi:hypothetical protein
MRANEPDAMPPVDIFPCLQYVPEAFAGWKRDIRDIKERQQALYERLFEVVERRMEKDKEFEALGEEQRAESFMRDAIRHAEQWGLSREMLL